MWRGLTNDGSAPSIVVNSIDLTKMLDLIGANELPEVTAYLSEEIQKLARAGADVGLFAANTPHIVFDEVQRRSSIPLISIVEATREVAQEFGLSRLGLFGTRFTMQGRFYPDVFSKAGISLIVPEEDEQAYIHDKYMNELVMGIFLPETRERLLTIIDRLAKQEHAQGLILAGTELPLILRDTQSGIPFLYTTEIHVKAAINALLS
jgi:aspartate racemase